ncbi:MULTISPECIES: chloramphenicol acetyltransferase [unclassified Clostridium]|uniref:chloramphenicol acetyltransferase n=1 Tax=unclassified Clostridium TaxID=2614128 RepID=UPI001DB10DDC|nr:MULTISPECIES: chloramphenicol acetyltransferase [unclassified Clostridium]MBN1045716.1 chloramphenicol acetyltransferase CAT [Clostridium botulinum]
MNFKLIDIENWERKECFNHFMNIAKSTYSLTVNIDISKLLSLTKEKGYRFYPTFTWIVSRAINRHKEFKMGFDQSGNLGYFEEISPDYSVLNEKTKIMNSLCTSYNDNFKWFYEEMVSDMNNYKVRGTLTEQQDNFFLISCLPWLSYTSFDVTNQSERQFLFPMVTWGKYFEHDGKVLMPLTLQVHHAVADGYHCSLFYSDVQQVLENPQNYIE